jgi:flagellar biosynthetic protein FliP
VALTTPRPCRGAALLAALVVIGFVALVGFAGSAAAQAEPSSDVSPVELIAPSNPTPDLADLLPTNSPASVTVEIPDVTETPSQSVMIILALTVISVAPSLLILMTSFTRIAIVLSLTRNALGLQGVPPNQVIVGLSLFLTLFVMGPTFSQINEEAVQPMLAGEIDQGEAYDLAIAPIRVFMLDQTREDEIEMFVSFQSDERPESPDDVSITALVPAFILSELRTAFIIGFVIFIPFLVIDIIVSSSLMSMGMMMLPPILVSLPFKLMLFVMIDGWDLIIRSLITSFG